MSNTILSIIRESRIDDNRAPLIPHQVSTLLKKFSNLKIIVQPSKKRCFKDEEYLKAGAYISENISNSDIILGVKEVETSRLFDNKTYLFFSHTSKINQDSKSTTQGTPGMSKKELLRKVIQKNITLIDYENIKDNSGKGYRYLGFGRFAGIVGCYNTLNLLLRLNSEKILPRAFKINNYEKIKELISKQNFKKTRILLTGDGRVAKGSIEFLNQTNIKRVSIKDYLKNDYNDAIFCNLQTHEYVGRKDGGNFSIKDFILNPYNYKSKIKKYMLRTNILISSHYWDPQSPKLFSIEEMKKFKKLRIIGDITCDVNGSIPTTIRSTSILKPYYSINVNSMKEVDLVNKGIAVMAVDNLPSELPRESSEEFGEALVSEVIPYLIGVDDGRISRATIASKGKFCSMYSYLNKLIN